MLGVGFVAFSQIRSLWQFFLAFLVISVGAGLSGFLTVTVAIVKWFERKRARALAFGSMGFAIGGTAVTVVVFFVDRVGWRWTAGVSGVAVSVIVYFLARVLDGSPADYGQRVDGEDASTADVPRAEGLTDVHFTAGRPEGAVCGARIDTL